MFAKNVLAAARIGPRGKAKAGSVRILLGADRPRCRVTGVWQRNPISGLLELRWQAAAQARDSDDVPGGPAGCAARPALVTERDGCAAIDLARPHRKVA